MTTTCGLYARALLPDLSNPVASYPTLATLVLPAGLLGLFALALMSIVMGTIDSYSLIAASTFSRDIIMRLFRVDESQTTRLTRLGLIVTMIVATVPLLVFGSVVDIWHVLGSVGTPALLVPVFFSFVGRRRLKPVHALTSIVGSGGISLVWYLSKYYTADGNYWYGTEPIFPGLLFSVILFVVFARNKNN